MVACGERTRRGWLPLSPVRFPAPTKSALALRADSFEPHPSQRLSSERHGVQPVEPGVYSDRNFSKRGEATVTRINGCDALRADGKSQLRRVIGINLYRKFSLRLLRICRI